MCDYSLHSVASRPAKVGDELVATVMASLVPMRMFSRDSAVGSPISLDISLSSHSGRTLLPTCECSDSECQRPPRYEPTSIVESDTVPTDGTRLLIVGSGDFGASPILRQLLRQAVGLTVSGGYASEASLSIKTSDAGRGHAPPTQFHTV